MRPTDSVAIRHAFGVGYGVKHADQIKIVPERSTRWITMSQAQAGSVLAYHMPRGELLPFAWAIVREWWRTRPGGMRTW